MHENQEGEREREREREVVSKKPDAFCPHKSLLHGGDVVKDNVCNWKASHIPLEECRGHPHIGACIYMSISLN
jgi:hypothetical protein